MFLKIKVHGLQVSVLAIVHKGSLETHCFVHRKHLKHCVFLVMHASRVQQFQVYYFHPSLVITYMQARGRIKPINEIKWHDKI